MVYLWDYDEKELKKTEKGRIFILERMLNYGPGGKKNKASPPVEGRGFLFQRKGSRFAGKAAFLASFIPAFGKAGYSEARNKTFPG